MEDSRNPDQKISLVIMLYVFEEGLSKGISDSMSGQADGFLYRSQLHIPSRSAACLHKLPLRRRGCYTERKTKPREKKPDSAYPVVGVCHVEIDINVQ
jgi:hypothetical protein